MTFNNFFNHSEGNKVEVSQPEGYFGASSKKNFLFFFNLGEGNDNKNSQIEAHSSVFF